MPTAMDILTFEPKELAEFIHGTQPPLPRLFYTHHLDQSKCRGRTTGSICSSWTLNRIVYYLRQVIVGVFSIRATFESSMRSIDSGSDVDVGERQDLPSKGTFSGIWFDRTKSFGNHRKIRERQLRQERALVSRLYFPVDSGHKITWSNGLPSKTLERISFVHCSSFSERVECH